MMAAGYRDGFDMTFRLGRCEDSVEITMRRALGVVGLPAEILGGNARSGPALRMSGRRRLARLAEIIGDPPASAPEGTWPVRRTCGDGRDRGSGK